MTTPPWDTPPRKTAEVVDIRGRKKPGPQLNKLTAKQQLFCNEVLKGMSLSEAYRRAYDAENMSQRVIATEASRLSMHPQVSLVLERGFEEKRRQATHTSASLREFVTNRLFVEATEAASDSARISALGLLGKIDHVAMFKERVGNEDDTRTAEELKAELEQRLKAAFDRVG